MNNIYSDIDLARKRLELSIGITRFILYVNFIVMMAALFYRHYELTVLSAFTCLFLLIASAVGRLVDKYLLRAEEKINASGTIQTQNKKAA